MLLSIEEKLKLINVTYDLFATQLKQALDKIFSMSEDTKNQKELMTDEYQKNISRIIKNQIEDIENALIEWHEIFEDKIEAALNKDDKYQSELSFKIVLEKINIRKSLENINDEATHYKNENEFILYIKTIECILSKIEKYYASYSEEVNKYIDPEKDTVISNVPFWTKDIVKKHFNFELYNKYIDKENQEHAFTAYYSRKLMGRENIIAIEDAKSKEIEIYGMDGNSVEKLDIDSSNEKGIFIWKNHPQITLDYMKYLENFKECISSSSKLDKKTKKSMLSYIDKIYVDDRSLK